MSRERFEAVIKDFIVEDLSCSINEGEFTNQRLIEDIGLDDLDKIELAMHLENELNIEIDDDSIDRVNTIKELIDLCEKLSN